MTSRLGRAAAAVIGAVLLSQLPAFADQYRQRLGGRLDQAEVQVARLVAAARAEEMSLSAYVERFRGNPDSVVRRQGGVLVAEIADRDRLRAAAAAYDRSAPVARPLVLLARLDANLARAVLDDFVPALPLQAAGLLYAMAGLLAGLGLPTLGRRGLRAVRRSRSPA